MRAQSEAHIDRSNANGPQPHGINRGAGPLAGKSVEIEVARDMLGPPMPLGWNGMLRRWIATLLCVGVLGCGLKAEPLPTGAGAGGAETRLGVVATLLTPLAATGGTLAGAKARNWAVVVRRTAWAVGGLALLFWAMRLLDRKMKEKDEEERQRWGDEWEVGDEYPYCTEPPEPEDFRFDLSEPVDLTVPLLRQLEWKRFEELVCAHYAALGLDPQPTRTGASGGVDINLYRPGEHRPYAYVQCKSWVDADTATKLLCELAAVMAADRVGEGQFVTAGEFPDAARAFAETHSIQLIDGPRLVAELGTLPIEVRDRILREIMRGDYRTPTCPNCAVKMVLNGAEAQPFWGCPNFPRCQRKIPVRGG